VKCANQLVYRVNDLQIKVEHLAPAPGRYSSRFRICVPFVELYCLTQTERTSTWLSKLSQDATLLSASQGDEVVEREAIGVGWKHEHEKEQCQSGNHVFVKCVEWFVQKMAEGYN